jgi:hypothetical protein
MRKIFGGFGAFLQTPIGVIIATDIVWHAILWAAKIPINFIVSGFLLIIDIFAAYFLLDKLVYFFSQFVLPIQNPRDRQEIHYRVKNFDTGGRGPALFIKNGRVITHEGETDKRGPGVIVIDTASAVVLRTDTEIRDTVGPGVKFTRSDEYIAGSVDLRSQWQFIGPLGSDQPFLNPVPIPSPKEYNEMQGRRQQTSGLTRDGFEVSPTISIKFSVRKPDEKRPDESGVTSQYGYDANSVRNAITREVIYHDTAQNSNIRLEWNKLPAHLVVNLWREYVRKIKLSELFSTVGEKDLRLIEKMINKRVTQKDVVALDDTGEPTGEWVESVEYKQLEARGLQITEVRIHNVLFDPAIEEQIVQHWSAEWLKMARKEESQLMVMESLIGNASRDEASKSFARITTQQFGAKPTLPQRNPFKTLQLLIQPLKEYVLNESTANGNVESELRKLDEIWKWLLDNNPDGLPKSGGNP